MHEGCNLRDLNKRGDGDVWKWRRERGVGGKWQGQRGAVNKTELGKEEKVPNGASTEHGQASD